MYDPKRSFNTKKGLQILSTETLLPLTLIVPREETFLNEMHNIKKENPFSMVCSLKNLGSANAYPHCDLNLPSLWGICYLRLSEDGKMKKDYADVQTNLSIPGRMSP